MHKSDLWATADIKYNDINFSLSSFAMHKLGSKSYVFVERLNEFIVVCKCFELIQTVSARVTRFVSNGGSFSKMNLGGQHVTTLKGTIYVLLSLRNACRTVIFLPHPLEMCFFWSMTKLVHLLGRYDVYEPDPFKNQQQQHMR